MNSTGKTESTLPDSRRSTTDVEDAQSTEQTITHKNSQKGTEVQLATAVTSASRTPDKETLMCPACRIASESRITKKPGLAAYLGCAALALAGLCWLPFCLSRCQQRKLLCAECGELKAVIPARGCC